MKTYRLLLGIFLLVGSCFAQVHSEVTIEDNQTITGNKTFQGLVNITGASSAVQACRENNIRYVDDQNKCGWSGSDLGAWINSAYTDCLAGTCAIKVSSSSGNTVSFSTPITFTTLDKLVNLECVSPSNSQSTGGLVLNYTPTTATTMLAIDNQATSGLTWTPNEIKGCIFKNNNCNTQGGCASSASGVVGGTTNGGYGWLRIVNSALLGFGNCVTEQNATGGWGLYIDNSTIGLCTVGLNITAASEVINISDSRIISNARGIKTTTSGIVVNADRTQFDSNTVLAIDSTGGGGYFNLTDDHFENFNVNNCNYVQGPATISMKGGDVINDYAACASWFFNMSGATQHRIWNVNLGSINGATPTNAFQINAPACATFDILNTNTGVFNTNAKVIGGSTSCTLTGAIEQGNVNYNPWFVGSGTFGAAGLGFYADQLTGPFLASAGSHFIEWSFGGSDGLLMAGNLELRMPASGCVGFSSNVEPFNAAADGTQCRAAAGVLEASTSASSPNSAGQYKAASFISGGTAATLSGTGACASRASQLGGATAGQVQCTGTTGASTLTITTGLTAPNGMACFGADKTTASNPAITASSTTACTLTFASVTANDVITFGAILY